MNRVQHSIDTSGKSQCFWFHLQQQREFFGKESDILKEFLEKHRAEAKAMSIFEYDQEKHIRMEREEAWEEGRREGRESGLREGEENTKRIFKLAQAGKTPKEIAEICEVSVEKVQHILE